MNKFSSPSVPFLKLVTQDLYNRYNSDISEVTIIFPNKRPEFYFYRYLAECSQKVILAPKITTFTDLVSEWSGLTLTDDFELTYRLFKVYQEFVKTDETFDKFLFWGELILSDFDDIDSYLAEPEKVFAHITQQQKLSDLFSDEQLLEPVKRFWATVYDNNPTELKKRFVDFWEKLLPIYKAFTEHLLQNNLAYRGLMERKTVELLKSDKIEIDNKPVVLVGFETLSNAEIEILKVLKSKTETLFYWDYDTAYIKPPFEAGVSISKLINQFPSLLSEESFNSYSTKKNIHIIDALGITAQAQIAVETVKKLDGFDNPNPNNIALILADERLLLPVLSAFPQVENLNITLGWNVKYSTTASFIVNLCDIWVSATIKNGKTRYSSKAVKKLSEHQFIDSQTADIFVELCGDYLFFDMIQQSDSQLVNLFLPQQLTFPIEQIIKILRFLLKEFTASNQAKSTVDKIDIEIIFKLLTGFLQLKNVYSRFDLKLEVNTQIRLIQQTVQTTKVQFEGSPLNGIQITNLSQTLNLDFANLIIAGANEGILPSSVRKPTYLPYSIRKAFHLPTFEDNTNSVAYQLYRLMQKSENITFIYNSDEQEVDDIEVSRFVQQIQLEQDWNFVQESYSYKHSIKPVKSISFPWNQQVEEYMKQFVEPATKSLSPSAINAYIDCPLKFYFTYCAGMKEPQITQSTLDNRNFGNLLHSSIEEFYNSADNSLLIKEITASDLKKHFSEIDDIVNRVYSRFREINQESGYNILYKDLVKEYIKQIIKNDIDYTPFKILGIEHQIDVLMPVPEHNISVKLYGKIDRIDSKQNILRVLDYKTGNPDTKIDWELNSLFDESPKRSKEGFQAFMYAWLLKNSDLYSSNQKINTGLVVSRKIYGKGYQIFSDKNGTEISFNDVENIFTEKLQQILSKMFNTNNDFCQTTITKNCEFCSYNVICGLKSV